MGRMIEAEPPSVMEHYKLVILGDSTVGKSSLLHYEIHGKDIDCIKPTFVACLWSVYPREFIKFDLWEVAGQESWNRLAIHYYKGSQAALIVYDVQNYHSFKIAKVWINELRQNMSEDLIIALVGNKLDLWDPDCVNSAEVQNYAFENGLIFMETSAKTGTNVCEVFLEIADELKKQAAKKYTQQCTKISKKSSFCVIL